MKLCFQRIIPLLLIAASPWSVLAQESITPQPGDLALDGTATYLPETREYRLTQDTYNQAGNIFTQAICAKEYKVAFDVFVGERNAAQNGGAGVVFYEIDAATGDWMNVVELNVQDRARPQNYNFLELVKFGEGPAVFLGERVPFAMGGAGYMRLEYSMNEGLAHALLLGGPGVASVAAKRSYVPGTATRFRFYAWTGAARNIQKIKNLRIDVVRPDNCSGEPPLGLDGAAERVAAACGDGRCDSYGTFHECAVQLLDGLKRDGVIDLAVHDALAVEYRDRLTYCSGQNDCQAGYQAIERAAYQRGFEEGAASIDQDRIRSEAFGEGYDAGYEQGFHDGLNAEKVTICHTQPRKLPVTITVSRNALGSHLGHGDLLGACPIAREQGGD